MLYCFHCGHNITSTEHADRCTTVDIQEFIEKSESNISDLEHKPLMTHGLNNCTAVIIVVYKNNKPIKIVFGHDPDRISVSKKFQKQLKNMLHINLKYL